MPFPQVIIKRYDEESMFIMVVLSFGETDEILMGRSVETDVKFTDLSISRVHSRITRVENKFYLQDCDSKYGTCVIPNDEIKLQNNSELELNLNKGFFQFKVSKGFLNRMLFCCRKKADYNWSIETESQVSYAEQKVSLVEVNVDKLA